MKNNILSFILIGFLVLPVLISAQTLPTEEAPLLDVLPAITTIINLIFAVLLIFAAIMLIWAGFSFITAGGDATKVGEARQRVLYAIIGVLVAFLARGMLELLKALMTTSEL